MEATQAVLAAVLPVYLLILAGAALRRIGVLQRGHDESIFHLVFNVLYPCLILDKILGSDSVRNLGSALAGIALGFWISILCVAAAWWLAGCLGFQKGGGRRTFALTAGIQNFGYTAIPVVEQVWKGGGAVAMLFVHNLGVELAIWTFGVMLMTGERKVSWRRLVNGPVISVLLGLLLAGSGADRWLDGGPVRQAMHWLGAGTFPIAILLTGAVMSDLIGEDRPSLKVLGAGLVVRLALLPALMLGVTKLLPLPVALEQVMVVQAAMPSAMTPVLLARIYGGRPGVAAQIVVVTTAVSLLTLPVVVAWGIAWLGLQP